MINSNQPITDNEIERQLAPECEGKLYEHLWLQRLNKDWFVHLDYYTVRDGIVYWLYGNRGFEATGDSLLRKFFILSIIGVLAIGQPQWPENAVKHAMKSKNSED